MWMQSTRLAVRRTAALAAQLNCGAGSLGSRLGSSGPATATDLSAVAHQQQQLNEKHEDYYKFWIEMPTRWTDNDQYGHINNAVYYHYFDSVVNRYLIEHCKLDPSAIRINGGAPSNTDNNSSRSTRIFYVVSSNAKYHAAASYPDVLRLGMSIAKLGRSSVTYRIGVFAPLKNGHDTVRWRCAVTGEFVHVCVDAMTGRPLQIADDMRSALERVVSPDN